MTAIESYQRGIDDWSHPRTTEAIASFERALTMDPAIASIPYFEGLERARAGEFEGAEAWLWIALLFRPDDVPSLTCLGDVLRSLGRTEEALPLAQKAVVLAPGAWEA